MHITQNTSVQFRTFLCHWWCW